MGLTILERAILKEAKEYTGLTKLKMSDILEWSTAKIKHHEGEVEFLLPKLQIYISISAKE